MHEYTHLVLQNKDEDVVGSHSKHQEGHDLQNDQRRGDSYPGVEAHGGQDGTANHQDPTKTHQKLRVHLQVTEIRYNSVNFLCFPHFLLYLVFCSV